ncbi:protein kinase domain-containing protein [Singulisphaera rosea]
MTATTSPHPDCPRCGTKVAADAPEGLCVRCLANLNFTADSILTGADVPRSEPLSREEIAPHFPQLEVLACLGRGGMGVVYKARQKSLDRLVALKILAPEREKDPQFAERFAREAQALARLSHPHIVTVYDFGRANGLFYLLMEYVDGVNLRQLLRSRRLESKEALAIVPPICEALQYAHDHAVVHRDIKPENLLIDKAGRVKIADFGIAKLLGGDRTHDEEQGVGTPRYMAPEQHATPRAADHRADIYSLGVVLFEMLTGELPARPFEPPSRKVQIDVRLDEIVLRALNREPELRFQNAEHMKTAVETLTKIARETPPPAARVHRFETSNVRRTSFLRVVLPIAIIPAAWLLAASMGLLDPFRVRFSGESPEARKLKFAEIASRGAEAFRRADYDQAIVAFDELIRIDPNHSEAHRWRGDASLNKYEFDKAIHEYNAAIRLNPKNGMAYSGRAIVSVALGEFAVAIATFDEAVRLNPRIANLPVYKRHRMIAESASMPRGPRNPKFAEIARRGLDAFQRTEYARAIVAFDELIRIAPDHPEAHRWRGDAYLNTQELDQARDDYDEAIRLDPRNGMAYYGRGAVSIRRGEYDKAIASFDEAIRTDPTIANTPYYKRSRLVADLLRPRPRNPKFDEAAGRGLLAFKRGEYDQAIIAFDELIRIAPNHSEAHRWRGDASLNKYEFDRALYEYDEAIRLDPSNSMAHRGRRAASIKSGEFDESIASFDEPTRLDPRIADTPTYQRDRAFAESPWAVGILVVVPLLAFGIWLGFAFAKWPALRHRKPRPEMDF